VELLAPIVRRAARNRIVGIAEPYLTCSSGTLIVSAAVWRDDRVRAGADVGHVGLDDDTAAAFEPHPGADLVSRLLRKAAATPMPISQSPPDRSRLRVAPAPAEALRPRRRHSTSLRCENGRSGFSDRPGCRS